MCMAVFHAIELAWLGGTFIGQLGPLISNVCPCSAGAWRSMSIVEYCRLRPGFGPSAPPSKLKILYGRHR